MGNAPIHDWMRPRLAALIADAERAGIARDVAVAVLLDLATGPAFNPSPMPPEPERGTAASAGYRGSTITDD